MIYDKLVNVKKYLGINKNLDTAIEFLAKTDLNELPLGKTEIDGDNVFIKVMEAQAAPIEEKRYEIHKQYLDIQIDLVGTEAIQIGNEQDMECKEFDDAKDIGKGTSSDLAMCTMGPGNFIICMTMEPHKPNIKTCEDTYLKKAVVKVLW